MVTNKLHTFCSIAPPHIRPTSCTRKKNELQQKTPLVQVQSQNNSLKSRYSFLHNITETLQSKLNECILS